MLLLGASASPATARTQTKVMLKGTEPVRVRYTGLTTNPGQSAGVHKPADCVSAPYCDVIRVEVQLPQEYNEDLDEFSTSVMLEFNPNEIQRDGPEDVPENASDLDFYVYDLTGAEVATGATASQPEKTATVEQKFDVVVSNFSGPNVEYFLTFQFKIKRVAPFEQPSSGDTDLSSSPSSGASDTFGSRPSSASEPTSPSGSGSGTRPSAASSSFSSTTRTSPSAPSILPAPIDAPPGAPLVTPSLPNEAGFLGEAEVESQQGNALGFGGSGVGGVAAPLAPAGPVSAAVLIFWMGVVPLMLVGVGAFIIRRRSPSVLRLG